MHANEKKYILFKKRKLLRLRAVIGHRGSRMESRERKKGQRVEDLFETISMIGKGSGK